MNVQPITENSDVVCTKISFSSDVVPGIFHFLFPRPMHLTCLSIMKCPLTTAITILSMLLWSLSSYSLGQTLGAVLPVSETNRLRLTERVIALSIVSLQVLNGIPVVKNFSENLTVVPFVVSSFALEYHCVAKPKRCTRYIFPLPCLGVFVSRRPFWSLPHWSPEN